MDSAQPPSGAPRIELLELDIDLRLHSVTLWALSEAALNEGMVAGFLRMAYVAGYQDALSEPSRGQLFRDHGYRVPTKRRSSGGR